MILSDIRVATNLANMKNLENSGNLKNCQNLRENSGKFEFLKKNLETQALFKYLSSGHLSRLFQTDFGHPDYKTS